MKKISIFILCFGLVAQAVDPKENGGRLTLVSKKPISTTDVKSASTVYFTSHQSDQIALFQRGSWKLYGFSEVSLSLKNLVAEKNYDVFAYLDEGLVQLALSNPWTNDQTRADQLKKLHGVLVLANDVGYRYLGTLRATSDSSTEDSQARRLLFNYYWPAERLSQIIEPESEWTYDGAWRPLNNKTSHRIDILIGYGQENASIKSKIMAMASDETKCFVGAGIDTIQEPHAVASLLTDNTPSVLKIDTVVKLETGFHSINWLERSKGDGYCTFGNKNEDNADFETDFKVIVKN